MKRRNLRYELMFFLARLLSAKRLDPKAFPTVTASQVSLLDRTTNNVLRVTVDGKPFFFRECRIHSEKHEYVKETVKRFFALRPSDGKEALLPEFLSALEEKESFSRFFFMGFENDPASPLRHFQMTGDASVIGLSSLGKREPELTAKLARFAWGELIAYRLNGGLPLGSYQTYHAFRSVATAKLAERLKPGLVPKTRFSFLMLPDGSRLFGTLMEPADGVDPTKERFSGVTGNFQKELLTLHALDTLTHERDHRPGNYFVTEKSGAADGVSAFDNDAPMTFFPTADVSFSSYMGCSPLVLGGKINRPYFPAKLGETLENLGRADLRILLSDCLTPLQIHAVGRRLAKLNVAVKRAKQDPAFLLSDDAFNGETVKRECDGSFGETYLSLIVKSL